jgi:hypothetical protein
MFKKPPAEFEILAKKYHFSILGWGDSGFSMELKDEGSKSALCEEMKSIGFARDDSDDEEGRVVSFVKADLVLPGIVVERTPVRNAMIAFGCMSGLIFLIGLAVAIPQRNFHPLAGFAALAIGLFAFFSFLVFLAYRHFEITSDKIRYRSLLTLYQLKTFSTRDVATYSIEKEPDAKVIRLYDKDGHQLMKHRTTRGSQIQKVLEVCAISQRKMENQ